MNKKVIIIASAVLAFFAGAIWVSEVPVVATLVAFLEVCAGFGCGFFYKSVLDEEKVSALQQEINSLKASNEEKKVRVTVKKNKATTEE